MSTTELHHGDCLEVLASMPSDSVAAIVTDPPYGIAFMQSKWDYDVPSKEIWEQCLRVLKPGGHLLAFAGTRTQHRMAVNIEDAGFEIRDMIAWVYGSGFPKSQNVGKAIDKAAGVEHLREFKSKNPADRPYTHITGKTSTGWQSPVRPDKTHPYSQEAQQWDGWGTALKPALEPITVARKPFKGTVAANVLEHGTGALNIDGCRVEAEPELQKNWQRHQSISAEEGRTNSMGKALNAIDLRGYAPSGRWPANLIHDGSDEVTQPLNDSARFFYTAKASKDDRDKGNTHPTVKPTDLMAYLCRLVTPVGGTVLDPFMGSGTTGKAALSEGFSFVGIERDAEYYAICESRFNGAQIGLALAV